MELTSSFTDLRLRRCNNQPVRRDGDFVLYWMIAARRLWSNFALQRAADWARLLGTGLLVFEPLRCDYPWASDRLHRFVIEGMADNAAAAAASGIGYYPYVEPGLGIGKGLLSALADRAALVVTDDSPVFFLPRMVEAAGTKLPVRLEAVDGNGLLPLAAADRAYPTAYAFRRLLQKALPAFLADTPEFHPGGNLRCTTQEELLKRWPAADLPALLRPGGLSRLPIDHDTSPVNFRGGAEAAKTTLRQFLDQRLDDYGEARNNPDRDATSRLSPYLHFGHISVHAIFRALADWESWSPDHLSLSTRGKRSGWWGMSQSAEEFLDELVTWRELGFNLYRFTPHPGSWESLPPWARATLEQHADDPRPDCYLLDEFRSAATHDPLWNAAQRQLLTEGRIHGYLRMLWGKKILEWSRTPQEALAIMLELNNRYALDGRDPNSTSGITWCLGRFDRPWGPERPIFGKIRSMSSANTARKTSVAGYLERYGRCRD